MALHHPEEGGYILAPVVDHLGARPRITAKKHAAHADEGFGIGGMRQGADSLHQALGQIALAADPRRRRTHRRHRL